MRIKPFLHKTTYEELAEQVERYGKNWKKWLDSPACTLNIRQVQIVRDFLKSASLEKTAVNAKLQLPVLVLELNKALWMLKLKYFAFRQWEIQCYIEELVNEDPERAKFFTAPVALQPFSKELLTKLRRVDQPDLTHILLRYTSVELCNICFWTEKELSEFNSHLRKHRILLWLQRRGYY